MNNDQLASSFGVQGSSPERSVICHSFDARCLQIASVAFLIVRKKLKANNPRIWLNCWSSLSYLWTSAVDSHVTLFDLTTTIWILTTIYILKQVWADLFFSSSIQSVDVWCIVLWLIFGRRRACKIILRKLAAYKLAACKLFAVLTAGQPSESLICMQKFRSSGTEGPVAQERFNPVWYQFVVRSQASPRSWGVQDSC